MKILYLCHRIPYPPNKGDKIRSFNEIKHLSASHDIHLACLADNAGDLNFKPNLAKYCAKTCVQHLRQLRSRIQSLFCLFLSKPLSVGHFYSPSLQTVVDGWLSQTPYDAIICFSSPMAEYVFRSKSFNFRQAQASTSESGHRPQLIMDFVDLDSDKWLQYAHTTRFPLRMIYRIENRRLFAYEKKINGVFDHSIFVSDHETHLFRKLYPQAKHVVSIPNGVDYDYFSPQQVTQAQRDQLAARYPQLKPDAPMLLFTGAMDYHANVEGVTWFCHEILPRIRSHISDVLFFIVGSNPCPRVKALGKRKGVFVTGFVEDMRPYYDRADICVTPLRLGRGVQNKVLEALAMQKPVVATPTATQGIMALNGTHLLMAEDSTGFSDACLALLTDHSVTDTLGKTAQQLLRTRYDWNVNMKVVEGLLHAKEIGQRIT